ncbi:MAG: Grx4 family monothiol glutaredoxin [Myxococcota bacterium]|nr:Grx4 family monothiol glutaredoxin [Myxococcota bacterium]
MLDDQTRQRIDGFVASHRVVLFMKGNRMQPQCGFSATVVGILDELVDDYTTVDVLSDPAIRQGIKDYSSWPTIPQLYLGGEFIGGCDIIQELYGSGELHQKLGMEAPERIEPQLEVTEKAAAVLRAALERSPGQALHLRIDANGRAEMGIGAAQPHLTVVESNGVKLHMDGGTARRADGLRIDANDTPRGPELVIRNPNAAPGADTPPGTVGQMDVQELKRLLDAGETVHLFDVRNDEERETARIEGARQLTEEVAAEIERMPKDTRLVFHCHHGGRSQQAAEYFAQRGFQSVYNVVGGIDAWSQQVDPSVPRY